jgi:hypothetical protein
MLCQNVYLVGGEAMLRKIPALVFAAALLAAMALPLLGGGGTAEATIHPIVSSECAANESQTGAGDVQDPPGQTPGATPGQGALKAIFALLANGALTADQLDNVSTTVWGGPAYNGDNGDEHCQNPDANTHPD